jgi:hypothetical protein
MTGSLFRSTWRVRSGLTAFQLLPRSSVRKTLWAANQRRVGLCGEPRQRPGHVPGLHRRKAEFADVEHAFLTPAEAAEAAGVTRQCVTRWCHKLPGLGHRVVGRWRVDPAALEALLTPTPAAGGDRDQRAG